MCRHVVQEMPLGNFFDEQYTFALKMNGLGLTDGEMGLLTAIMIMNPGQSWTCYSVQQLTIVHILLECPNMESIRHKYFDVDVSSLGNLFQCVDNQNTVDFIKETHLITTYSNVCYPHSIVAQYPWFLSHILYSFLLLNIYIYCHFHNKLDGTKWLFICWCALRNYSLIQYNRGFDLSMSAYCQAHSYSM